MCVRMAMFATQPVVLLVEDDLDTIKLIKLTLRKAGFDNPVCEVRDGQEAIDYLEGTGQYGNRSMFPLPQLILLDLKMPRVNGLEFLKWLRQWDPGKLIPVVVLTSSVFAS